MSLISLVKTTAVSPSRETNVALMSNLRKKYEITEQIFFLLDCSGSMDGEKLHQAKRGIAEFSERISPSAKLNFIAFSDDAREVLSFKEVKADGSTNLSAALSIAQEKMQRSGHRTIILATDGKANSPEKAIRRASSIKESGIKIICIGTDNADEDFLKKLSSRKDWGEKVLQKDFGQAIAQSQKLLLS